MSVHKFWKGLTELNISPPHQVPERIVKISSVDNKFVILCADKSLYSCDIIENNIKFEQLNGFYAKDIACINKICYHIDPSGKLIKTDCCFQNHEEIVVREVPKICSHGQTIPGNRVKFKNVVASEFGVLLISNNGELWGSGTMPQISINSDNITKVPFFEGRTVYSASVGDNFAAVVSRKKFRKIDNCDTESDDEETVFASDCLQCQDTIKHSTPTSPLSLETCPLGVQINNNHKTPDETQSNSSNHSYESEIHTDAEFVKDPNTSELESIFTNREAAKQFFRKQLSWVSTSEDYITEYTEKPTRIIKENVTNITNLVYESVKTVGDKVASLSKQGNNDNCILNDTTDLLNSFTVCNIDDFKISTSTLNSDRESESPRLKDNIKIMTKSGKNILSTELWTWGDISHGQLGTSDQIKRLKPVLVSTLSGLGLQKVSCGKAHTCILTLDGRVFSWGYNHYHQVSLESRDDKSGPKQLPYKENDRIRDVTATDHHTLIYTQKDNIFYMGKHIDGYTEEVVNLNNKVGKDNLSSNNCNDIALVKIRSKKNPFICQHYRVLSSQNISYCCLEDSFCQFDELSIGQKYLEDLTLINSSLVKPFMKKTKSLTFHADLYESLCDLFSDIVNLTALNVLSLWQHAEKHINASDIIFIKNLEEFVYLYKTYNSVVCNLIVIGGFSNIITHTQVPMNIYNLFNEQTVSVSKLSNNKKLQESSASMALIYPLSKLNNYKTILESLIKNMEKSKSTHLEKLQKCLTTIQLLIEEHETKSEEADMTKLFFETSGKVLDLYRLPERRLLKESKSSPLMLLHPGRFATHWFILFNDVFVHLIGNTVNVHQLESVWVEPVMNSVSLNVLQIITPEETILVHTNCEMDKHDWLNTFNSAIKTVLKKESLFKPPSTRTASHTFSSKNQFFKDAKYLGRWLDGKLHGHGKVEWPDGKVFAGRFKGNTLCGHGKMEIPNLGIYEGQWKDNQQNGYGVMKYTNGDIYEGYFKDGQCHGHGVKKQGDFNSSNATIYTGEWLNGMRSGYGVMDDIGKGEKYLGQWSENKKHGCGLIVTLDGIYYEGIFMHDVLTGHGVMIFEDGTHYEGEFRAAGVFSGKGVLTFSSGDKIEGCLNGAWTDGVKISNATMQLNVSHPVDDVDKKPSSFGKLCVPPNQKWNALFRQCYKSLGIPQIALTPTGHHFTTDRSPDRTIDNNKIWENVAVAISASQKNKHSRVPLKFIQKSLNFEESTVDCLEQIPKFGQQGLTLESWVELKSYLQNACESSHHPLGRLVVSLTNAFNSTYGGVRVHPLLLSHAVKELKIITSRLYELIRLLFPALPPEGVDIVLPLKESIQNDFAYTNETNPMEGEVVSSDTLLQAILLPRVHPALFVLYALHNKKEDDMYWKRLLKWNKQPDITLMAFLGIDQKFWLGYVKANTTELKEQLFMEAVETLQQLKTTFSPMEKLMVVKNTFQKMTDATQLLLGESYLWTMDELFPVFNFVVVRARILQLGSEIHFIEDFLDPGMQHGELGLMFTTFKACYFQILQEKMSIY